MRTLFTLEKNYGQNKWLFEKKEEELRVLKESYKEFLRFRGLPLDKGWEIMIMGEINEVGEDDGSLFGKVDYSKTTYSIKVKAMLWIENDKEANYWEERFKETIN